jgi:hypothetical protein
MVNIFLSHEQHLLKNGCIHFAVYLQGEIIIKQGLTLSLLTEYKLLYFYFILFCTDQNFEIESNQDSVVLVVFLIYLAYILLDALMDALMYSYHKFI